MLIRNLSDKDLLLSIEKLVEQEREILTAVLRHLREIERRRLFSDLGYASLFDYACKKLRYTGDQAARRIAAMRLLKDFPEFEDKLESGELSLTNAATAQNFLKKQKHFSADGKRKLIQSLENKSTREADRIMAEIHPLALSRDRIKPVAKGNIEIRFVAPASLEDKLQKLKDVLAHKYPGLTYAELIDKLADLGLSQWSESNQSTRSSKTTNSSKRPPAGHAVTPVARREVSRTRETREQKPSDQIKRGPLGAPQVRKSIPRKVRLQVLRRDGWMCSNCQSTHALEIDHIKPLALGGVDVLENLRVLCRSCNQRAAIQNFGLDKMMGHLESHPNS